MKTCPGVRKFILRIMSFVIIEHAVRLFSTPLKTVVERNLFDHTSGTAILLCGDCNGWFETGACRNVLIRNNRFINALTNMFQFTEAVYLYLSGDSRFGASEKYFHGGKGEKGVVIEDNLF